jgi:hypothetical protein
MASQLGFGRDNWLHPLMLVYLGIVCTSHRTPDAPGIRKLYLIKSAMNVLIDRRRRSSRPSDEVSLESCEVDSQLS